MQSVVIMANSSAPLHNLLDALKRVSVVVADTGDFNQLKECQAQDATTNPTLILAASLVPDYKPLINDAIAYGTKSKLTGEDLITLICDRLCVNFGKSILEIIPGVVSTEVDAMLSFDTGKSVEKARRLIQMYQEVGVPRERVLIKLASTWEGIKAAEVLEKEDIRCNLTLLFSLCQAVAAADANATLISPFVGRILDWHKSKCPSGDYEGFNDPGVQSVTQIYNYYKRFGYKTVVMGASFRNTSEILALAGCDKLTVSPKLLKELQSLPCPPEGELVPQLSTQKASTMQLERLTINESTFRWMLNEDSMATEKLAEGIRTFHRDNLKLRQFVRDLISKQ